jgi:hypothetical protein
MDTATIPRSVSSSSHDNVASFSIPVYVYATIFSSLSIMVGLNWDISWHMSVGRDGLFSAPHLAMYLGAVIAGIFSGYRVLYLTFAGTAEMKAKSINFWKVFYGSLGALFCIWGAFAMITSAPFDDWWHNTYGLDVQILSPPHSVLGLGIIAVQFGAMVSVLALQNQYADEIVTNKNLRTQLQWCFALSSGFMLAMVFTIASEYLSRHQMHHALFYQVAGGLFPLFMVAVSVSSTSRWGATGMAAIYMLFMMIMLWILPLFPAEPLLGPILNHITHFQNFFFPLLLVVPAIGVDLVINKMYGRNAWLKAFIIGVTFVIVLVVAQWPFADFLMSPYARNWFFGSDAWSYNNDPHWEYRFSFPPWNLQSAPSFLKGLAIAVVFAIVSTRLGIQWGNWMKRIQR